MSVYEVTLEEITPEKIQEIEDHIQVERFIDLTRNNLCEFGEYRKMIKAHMAALDAEAEMLAIRGANAGLETKEMAECLGMTTARINKITRVY